MKKTTQIHIGGRHFNMDEEAYRKLNHYLESLNAHFASDGETGKEIVEDIEQRIAELLENKVSEAKNAITLEDVTEVINILGKVEDFNYSGEEKETQPGYEYHNRRDNRRLYRDPEKYYLGGVASGMGEYFDIDPLWIRLAFVFLVFFKGVGLLIYAILWIAVPRARTTTEKLQMRGKPVNLSTIKESVNEEYEKVKTSVGGLSKSQAADNARNALENIIRAIGLVIVAVFKFIIGAIGVFFLVLGSIFLAGLLMVILGFTNVFGHIQVWDGMQFPELGNFFIHSGHYYAAIIALVILVLIPIAALIYGGIKILFNIRTRHPVLRAFLLTAWILSLILFITLIMVNIPNSPIEATGKITTNLESSKSAQFRIVADNNTESKNLTHYRVFGYTFDHSRWDDAIYEKATLSIEKSEDNSTRLIEEKTIKNIDLDNSQQYIDRVEYRWSQTDSALTLDTYFHMDEDDFWLFADVDLLLTIPEGREVVISREVCGMLKKEQYDRYCKESGWTEKTFTMNAEGVLEPAK